MSPVSITDPYGNLISDLDTSLTADQARRKQEAAQLAAQEQKEQQAEQALLKEIASPPKVTVRESDNPSDVITAGPDGNFTMNLHALTAPPKEEAIYRAKHFKAMLGISAAFAALGALATHGNIAVAINAFSGGLKGFAEGNEQKYAQGYQIWARNTQTAIDDNKARIAAMQDILKERDLSLGQRLALLKITASDNQILSRALERNDLSAFEHGLNTLIEATNRFQKTFDQQKGKLKPTPPVTPGNYSDASIFLMRKLIAAGRLPTNFTPATPSSTSPGVQFPLLFQAAYHKLAQKAKTIEQQQPGLGPDDALSIAYGELLKSKQIDIATLPLPVNPGS